MKKTLLGMALTMAATVVVASGSLAQEVPTVRYGIYEPGFDSGFLLMAQEKGFWEEQGVNVEVVTFKSARQIFPASVIPATASRRCRLVRHTRTAAAARTILVPFSN